MASGCSIIFKEIICNMKSVFIEEKTLDSMWFQLLSELYKNGRVNHIDSGSFAGANRLEFDYAAGTIEHPNMRPLAPIMPEGVPPVTTDKKIEEYFVDYIMDGHNLAENEHYRYATFISGGKYVIPKWKFSLDLNDKNAADLSRDFMKDYLVRVVTDVPNQVEWVIKHYKDKGFGNNHCYIQVGYPESNFAYDIPFKNEAERQTSPCLRGIDTHIKNNKLHLAVVFRSWDLWGGWPVNMGGVTLLGVYMANELGIKMGPLSFSSLKLHCYDFQLEAVRARLNING